MQKLSHAKLAALVKQVQHGNPEAFATLYAATVEGQLYFATAFLKDAALAEDVVQEVYLSLYRNIHKLENPKLFIAYLNRISYNTCVSFQRKLTKRQFELDEKAMEQQRDLSEENDPNLRYDRLERSSQLQAALAKLPEIQRAAFLYRYYSELRITEIAAVMSCSESTVKRYIKSATDTLKVLMQQGAGRNDSKKGSNYAV